MKILVSTLCLLLGASWSLGHAGQPAQGDTYTLEELAPDLYLLIGGRGGNVAFRVGERGVLVVDDQFADLAPEIKKAIEKVTAKPIKYLINTHHHGDHSGGNAFFLRYTEIVAHHNVRQNLLKLRPQGVRVEDVASPTVTFEKEVRLYLDNNEIQVFHLSRGHTNGDSVVYFPSEKVAHMGDLYFNGFHPFIDRRGGASTREWIQFLSGVLERVAPSTRFIPGHGSVSDAEGLEVFRDYLRELRSKLGKAIEAGQTREEAIESTSLEISKDWPPRRGRDNIGIVYDELKEESLE